MGGRLLSTSRIAKCHSVEKLGFQLLGEMGLYFREVESLQLTGTVESAGPLCTTTGRPSGATH
jgi:hypothetical protein